MWYTKLQNYIIRISHLRAKSLTIVTYMDPISKKSYIYLFHNAF